MAKDERLEVMIKLASDHLDVGVALAAKAMGSLHEEGTTIESVLAKYQFHHLELLSAFCHEVAVPTVIDNYRGNKASPVAIGSASFLTGMAVGVLIGSGDVKL